MNRTCRAALAGGFLLSLALAQGANPAAAAADPKVEAELTRLIAGYAASGQEDMDKLGADQQKQLAACAADALGELPADDMALLMGSQDLEDVMDALGERLEQRSVPDAGKLRGCFDTAFAQIEGGGQPATTDTPAMTARPTAEGIDGEFLVAMEKVMRAESDPPPDSAIFEVMTCMYTTLVPAMTEAEKRAAIDTSFSDEVGQQLETAHPAEFGAFMTCGEAIAAKYE